MLKISKLTKSFKGAASPAVKSLDLAINEGEFCVVLGSNGSGKSTLLKCISGEYICDKGNILLGAQDITKREAYLRAGDISFVSQDTMLGTASEMTVLENMSLSLGRGNKGSFDFFSKNRPEIFNAIAELGVGLEEFIDKRMSLLSGGQRQTIATLMAMQPRPKLLLLDEHTSALDPKSRRILMDYTEKKIQENNITTLMITHNIEDALQYGSRLIIMQHGEIVYAADKEEKAKLNATTVLDILLKNEDFGTNMTKEK